MPFDGTDYKPEIKADPFSLDSLIAWLEQQDPTIEYDFDDYRGDCLVGRYLWSTIGRDAYYRGDKQFSDVFRTIDEYSFVAAMRPWTFGAALARALQAKGY